MLVGVRGGADDDELGVWLRFDPAVDGDGGGGELVRSEAVDPRDAVELEVPESVGELAVPRSWPGLCASAPAGTAVAVASGG